MRQRAVRAGKRWARTRFPRAIEIYRRHLAEHLVRNEQMAANYRLSAWAERGRALRDELGLDEISIDRDGIWIRDADGLQWVYTPGLSIMTATGAEFGMSYEAAERELAVDLLKGGGVFIDVGANVGLYSVTLARRIPNVSVHAFEPVSETRTMLERNLVKNGVADQVQVWPAAVSDQPGTCMVTTTQDVQNHVLAPGTDATEAGVERVQMVTLDEFMSDKASSVDLIKCDVEGSELAVFRGARGILQRDRPHLVVELQEGWAARYGHTVNDVVAFLEGIGYRSEVIGDGRGSNFLFRPEL
jgi:FkbM family methyltransferase